MSRLRAAILTALEVGPLATAKLIARLSDHGPADVRAELARLAAEHLIDRRTRTKNTRIGPCRAVSRTEYIALREQDNGSH